MPGTAAAAGASGAQAPENLSPALSPPPPPAPSSDSVNLLSAAWWSSAAAVYPYTYGCILCDMPFGRRDGKNGMHSNLLKAMRACCIRDLCDILLCPCRLASPQRHIWNPCWRGGCLPAGGCWHIRLLPLACAPPPPEGCKGGSRERTLGGQQWRSQRRSLTRHGAVALSSGRRMFGYWHGRRVHAVLCIVQHEMSSFACQACLTGAVLCSCCMLQENFPCNCMQGGGVAVTCMMIDSNPLLLWWCRDREEETPACGGEFLRSPQTRCRRDLGAFRW